MKALEAALPLNNMRCMMNTDGKPEPATVSMNVYAAREGEAGDVWAKDYGVLSVPARWEFLAAGNPYLTRTVKKLGPAWVLKKPDRRLRITKTLGLYAAGANIRRAAAMARETEALRHERKKRGARARAKQEANYRTAFRQAVLDYLAFAPKHASLAEKIAAGVAKRACPVGSGTVARTAKLTLEDKARLATRAYVRHRYTAYEKGLGEAGGGFAFDIDKECYRELKAMGNLETDDFIEQHRDR